MATAADGLYSIVSKKEYAHVDPIYCCDWIKSDVSGDARNASRNIIATGGLDCLVKVWLLQNDRLEHLYTLKGHTMAVISVVINPTSSTIVSSSLDSHIILWNLNTGRKVSEVPIGVSDVWKVVFSPDGDKIATGGHTGIICLYSVVDGALLKVMETRGKFIMCIDWSRNGEYIASGADDGIICILDVYQGILLHAIEAHTGSVRSISFTPCSKGIASSSIDGFVKIHGVIGAGLQCQLELETWATSVCFSPDGTRIAVGDAEGAVRVALASDLTVLHTFEEHNDTVWALRFDSSGKRLISVAKDGSINLYDCPTIKKEERM